MRILIEPDPGAQVNLSDEVRRALDVLHVAYIMTDGGGTLRSGDQVTGVIMLRFPQDTAKALAVLARAGIKGISA